MPNPIQTITTHLSAFRSRAERETVAGDNAILELLEAARVDAVAAGDQALAKTTWCLRRTLEIQQDFITAFRHMKSGKFYDGWCKLERVEIEIASLDRHVTLDNYGLAFIQRHTEQFQIRTASS